LAGIAASLPLTMLAAWAFGFVAGRLTSPDADEETYTCAVTTGDVLRYGSLALTFAVISAVVTHWFGRSRRSAAAAAVIAAALPVAYGIFGVVADSTSSLC
jgi:hypothetical protein